MVTTMGCDFVATGVYFLDKVGEAFGYPAENKEGRFGATRA